GPGVELRAITRPYCFSSSQSRALAAARVRAELGGGAPRELLCDGLQGVERLDAAERAAWQDWGGPRLSPKIVCGEGFMAAAAWQCVAAVDALLQQQYPAATVSIVGCNQQAIAAQFTRTEEVMR
ncbi:MAG TPA: hypothetical protein VNT26_22270, partial [Candidatus Sulfotelmatobacter sp.]|nr:hypothetical protein [Candidatus Sulfotelmatobacter sp.]